VKLSITTFNVTTLGIITLSITLKKRDTQHNDISLKAPDTVMLMPFLLIVVFLIVMLSAIMLNVVIVSVAAPT
jgi:hypothetical protein